MYLIPINAKGENQNKDFSIWYSLKPTYNCRFVFALAWRTLLRRNYQFLESIKPF